MSTDPSIPLHARPASAVPDQVTAAAAAAVATVPGRSCGGCAHWKRPQDRGGFTTAVRFDDDEWDDTADDGFGGYVKGAAADKTYGECQGVPEGWGLTGQPPLATVCDGSDFSATLFTQAEFHCALWTGA